MKKYSLFSLILLTVSSMTSFGQVDSVDIYDYDLNQLSKVKIMSASKTAQSIKEVATTVYVISSDEIKEKGYFTIEEILTDLPGFQFRNINGINSYVFQRGIPSQNNLILLLVDGILINELNSGGFYAGGQYNLNDIDRIEVVYGPASVAYGTNAVSGIINIITKKPAENSIGINSTMGSFNSYSTDFSYSHFNTRTRMGVRISGMYKQSDKADLKGEAGDHNWTDLMDNYERDYASGLKLQFKNFLFGTDLIQKQSSTATLYKATDGKIKDYGSFWNIRFINNYLKYNVQLLDNLTLSTTLYNRNSTVLNNSVYYIVDTAQIGYFRPNNLSGIEGVFNYKTNRSFSITGGLTFDYETLAEKPSFSYSSSVYDKPPHPEMPDFERNTLASVFLEPQLALNNKLFLSGGLRLDESSIYGQVLTPRFGISYNFRNQHFRLSYAEAFRAPKPWDYSDGLGNSSLLPEIMKSLEGALSLNYKKIGIDLIIYKNDLENAIVKQFINENYKWINEGVISTVGLDVYLKYASPKFKSALYYTFNNTYNTDEVLIPEISKHTSNASMTYYIRNDLKLHLKANYIGKRKNPKHIASTNSDDIDPALIFNGALTFAEYHGFEFQLIVKNILNTEYYHTSNRDPDRYRQPQRTIMISIGYSQKKEL